MLPQGSWRFEAQPPTAVAQAELSELAREIFADLLDQLSDVAGRLKKLDARIVAICRSDAACRRLATLPGVGPIIATALVAAVDDGRHFRSGRELAAWIRLVPRQYTTAALLANFAAVSQPDLNLSQLADYLLRRVTLPCHCLPPRKRPNLNQAWTGLEGAGLAETDSREF